MPRSLPPTSLDFNGSPRTSADTNNKKPRFLEGFWISQDKPGTRIGAPGGIRTPDQWLRKPLLYPAELRAPGRSLCQNSRRARDGWATRDLASHGVTPDVMTPASRPGHSPGGTGCPGSSAQGPDVQRRGHLKRPSPDASLLNAPHLTVRLSTRLRAVTAEPAGQSHRRPQPARTKSRPWPLATLIAADSRIPSRRQGIARIAARTAPTRAHMTTAEPRCYPLPHEQA